MNSLRPRPLPTERDRPGEEMWVYRPLRSHHAPLISPRMQWLLGTVVAACAVAYVAWSLQRIFPGLDREGWWALWGRYWQTMQEKGRRWEVLLYPLVAVVVPGGQWLCSRHLRLHIDSRGLWQEHRLPLGLHHLFAQNWRVDWSDVQGITTRRSSGAYSQAHPLASAEVVLQLRSGEQRVLRPAFWFRPEDPPRPRPKRVGGLQSAFADLRVIRALHRHAPFAELALPWPAVLPEGVDLNRQPEVLCLLGGTILVFLTGWSLMLFEPHLHLHSALTWGERMAWGLGTLAVWGVAWRAWRHRRPAGLTPPLVSSPRSARLTQREPLSRPALAFAALLWVAAVAFVAEPLLVHGAILGRADAWQTHRVSVTAGLAKPVSPGSASVPAIELPGPQSRLAWLKAGSEARVDMVQGRWGVWVYNDAPLRALADQQGVR